MQANEDQRAEIRFYNDRAAQERLWEEVAAELSICATTVSQVYFRAVCDGGFIGLLPSGGSSAPAAADKSMMKAFLAEIKAAMTVRMLALYRPGMYQKTN